MRLYRNTLKASLLFLVLGVLLASCYKEPNFSLTPSINFKSITKDIRLDQFSGAKKDSIVITINFQDGDGDLGFNSDEVGKTVQRTNFNYVVKLFRRVKGVYKEFSALETLSGFFPRLKSDNNPGPIEGNLSYRISLETSFWPVKKDTVKFEVYIKDRAGNKSNSIESTPVIINEF